MKRITYFKKPFIIFLVFVIGSLYACGVVTSISTNTTTSSQATDLESTSTTTGTYSETTTTYENTTISFVGVQDSDMSILLNGLSEEGTGETFRDNRWTQLYRDKLNVEIVYDWIALGWDNKREKLGLDLVAGDMSDCIVFDDIGMAMDTYDAGLTISLQDLFEEYASDQVKEFFATPAAQNLLSLCTLDGELIAIPEIASDLVQSPMMFIRKDWLDNLGLALPENREDVLNIIKAFRDDDPDKDGLKDTYGLGLTGNLVQYVGILNGFAEMYNSLPYIWYEGDSNQIEFGGVQENSFTALEELASLYNDDYIDKEFITKTETTLNDDIANGKIGLVFAPEWLCWNAIKSSYIVNPEVEWVVLPVLDGDGISKTINSEVYARGYIAINKDFSHPERIIQMINLYFDTVWGEDGNPEYYFSNTKYDNLWHLSPLQFLNPVASQDYDILTGLIAGELTQEDVTSGEWETYQIYLKHENNETLTPSEYALYMSTRTAEVKNLYYTSVDTITSWKLVLTTRTTIGNLQTDTYIQIIRGATSGTAREAWDQYVSEWYSRGGTALLQEYNDWFANIKPNG